MANNLIQIKRSNTSPTPANTLNGGELGYSYNSNALFIGAQTGISAASFKIAGSKFAYVDQATQGTLTANAVILVDANAFISNTFTSGLFIAGSIASPAANTTAALITSISPAYTAGQLGATVGGSNTELVTSWAIKNYVDNKTAAATTNTAAQYAWTNTHTFAANVSYIGNGSVVAFGNSTIAVGISANGSLGTTGQSLLSNGTSVYWGTPTGLFSNGTAYTFSAVETFNANVVLTSGNGTNQLLVGTINATSVGLLANSTIVTIGNSSVNTTINATSFSGTANNSTNFGGLSLATLQGQITGNAATAYTNATVFAANASTINSGTVGSAYLPANIVYWSNSNVFTAPQTFANVITNNILAGSNSTPSNTLTVMGSTFLRDKVQIGAPTAFDFGSTALIEIDANQNTYTQVVITNGNSGISASGDFVITADTGNDSVNFVDFGINSSLYSNSLFSISGALDAYLYSSNSNLVVGTASVKDIVFHAGGTTSADRKLTINTTAVAFANSVGILANGSLGTSGQVLSSNATGLYWQSPTSIFSNGTAYTWSAVQSYTSNIVSTASVLVGNTTTTNTVVNTSAHAVFANVGGVSNTIQTALLTTTGLGVNSYSINATANGTSTAAVVNTTTFALTSNVLSTNTSVAANAFVANTSAITLGNTTVNASLTTATLTVPQVTATAGANLGSQVNISNTLVNFGTVANVYAASANLTVGNMAVTGNLTVSGTLTTIDTVNMQVKDNIILLADQNTSGDAVDFGVVGQANSGLAGTQTYYGFARIATANAFQFFATNTAPGATTIASQTVMPLQAYLQPYGSGGAFVVNSTAVTATANATVAVNITANTITITSGLAATSGGTGRTTGFTAGDILFASNATYMSNLAIGVTGQVLQVSAGNLPSWGTLDGGTF